MKAREPSLSTPRASLELHSREIVPSALIRGYRWTGAHAATLWCRRVSLDLQKRRLSHQDELSRCAVVSSFKFVEVREKTFYITQTPLTASRIITGSVIPLS